MLRQACLFDSPAASTGSQVAEPIDRNFAGLRRYELGGASESDVRRTSAGKSAIRSVPAWVDYAPGWLSAQRRVFDELAQAVDWRAEQRQMYERVVSVPRLFASAPEKGNAARVIAEISQSLTARYRLDLSAVTIALYRDGNDSVAMHGDKMGRLVGDTIVATVSLGAPRRFVMKPNAGGPGRVFHLGWGDLFVMGGSCQKTWQHGVPKLSYAEPRISVMFRPRVPPELKRELERQWRRGIVSERQIGATEALALHQNPSRE